MKKEKIPKFQILNQSALSEFKRSVDSFMLTAVFMRALYRLNLILVIVFDS